MRPNRLHDILTSLSSTEWKGCTAYINGVSKETSDERRVWQCLLKNKKKLLAIITDIDKINDELSSQYSYSHYKKIISLILSHVDEYLLVQEFRKNKSLFNVNKVRLYYNRRLFEHGDYLSKKLNKEISANHQVRLDDSYCYMMLHFNKFYSDHPIKTNEIRTMLKELHAGFIAYVSQTAGLLSLEMTNREVVFDDDFQLEKKQLELLLSQPSSDYITHIFTRLERILLIGSSKDLNYVIGQISQQSVKFEPQIIKTIVILISNYLSLEIKQGRQLDKVSDLLEISKIGIANGILLEHGQLPLKRMINMIEFAGVNNQMEWAETLSQNYSHLVTAENEFIVRPYIRANIHFYNNEFDKCFAILKDLVISDLHEEFRRRELLVICAYELYIKTEDAFLLQFVKNYDSWLTKHKSKINLINFTGAKNHLKFIKLLLKKPFMTDILNDFVESNEIIRKRSWISKKLDELK